MSFQLVIAKGRHQGKSIRPKHSPFIIGRQKDCHLRAESMEISRQHCVIEVDGEHVRIKDLGSTNGTLVNNKKISGIYELRDRDLLQIGPLSLRFQSQASAHVDTQPGVQASTDTQMGVEASADTHAGVMDEATPPPLGNEEDAAATWMMNFDELPAPDAPAPKPVQAETKAGGMAQSILERYKKK